MSYLPEVEVGQGFEPFAVLRDAFGLVPNIFRAQTLLPRVIEAELRLLGTILLTDRALSRPLKELIALTIAAGRRNHYCVAMHSEALRAMGTLKQNGFQTLPGDSDLSQSDAALLDFALKLGQGAPSADADDIERLRAHGFSDQHILEAVLTAALSSFNCTLSVGLGVTPDFELSDIPRVRTIPAAPVRRKPSRAPRPFIRTVVLSADSFAPFAFFEKEFGFIPNMFRAQTLRPDIIEANVNAVRLVLMPDDVLPRVQKENILLVISAANLNTYCVAAHCELLRGLGVSVERSDQIAVDHRKANLPAREEALLDVALKLTQRPAEYGIGDIDRLRGHGFSDQQILEAIVMCAMTHSLHVANTGLGAEPDFEPPPGFAAETRKKLNLSWKAERPIDEDEKTAPHTGAEVDPDLSLVTRVQRGETEAFEELVRRHAHRIHRTLEGILRQPAEAEDAAQEVFFSAFRHIAEFEGRSKFSTWLMQIAVNCGLQRLRNRRPVESIDSIGEGEVFRPRSVQPWQQNPEQIYSRAETRRLVEREVMKLPIRYRIAVMLRDLQGLSTDEAAAAAGLTVPGLKTRLLRGRLMLRETLAPYFSRREAKGRHA